MDKPEVGDRVTATVLRPYNMHTATIHGEVVAVSSILKKFRVKYAHSRHMDFYFYDIGDSVTITKKAVKK